jgi:hypothetical protein
MHVAARMLQPNPGRASAPARERFPAMSPLNDLQFGKRQRAHIRRLADECGQPFVWDCRGELDTRARLIIVTRPPNGPQIEALRRSLESRSVVVIPFGENPSFDALKSRLNDYGMVAPSGSDGPHQLWWGGNNRAGFAFRGPRVTRPLAVSCHPSDADASHIARLTQSLRTFGLDHVIERIDGTPAEHVTGRHKIKFILDTWEKSSQPILWLDPDSVLTRPASLFDTTDCDVGLHKWRGWEIATRTLYFGRSAAAEAVLRTWLRFADMFPDIWEGYLLDQAWSLVASQAPLSTLWLPRSYHSLIGDPQRREPVIAHNLPPDTEELSPDPDFPTALRAARRSARTGSPEAQLVMTSRAGGHGTVAVLLRHAGSVDAGSVAAIVEDVAKAFDADPAGFAQLEVSLCPWQSDLTSALAAAHQENAATIIVDPTQRVPGNIFRDLTVQLASTQDESADRPSAPGLWQPPMHYGTTKLLAFPAGAPDSRQAFESVTS